MHPSRVEQFQFLEGSVKLSLQFEIGEVVLSVLCTVRKLQCVLRS